MKRLPLLVLLLSIGVLYTVDLSGQETAPAATETYNVGELVEIQLFGQWIEGIVVQPATGGYRVKFDHEGRRLQKTIPVAKIRRPSEGPIVPLTALRLWQDSSGKHSTKARLLAIDDAAVQLLKEDGSVLDVPIERLSHRDILLVRRLDRHSRVRDGERLDRQGRDPATERGPDELSSDLIAADTGPQQVTRRPQVHQRPAADVASVPGEQPTESPPGASAPAPNAIQSLAALGAQLWGGRTPSAAMSMAVDGGSGAEMPIDRELAWNAPPAAEPAPSMTPQTIPLPTVPANGFVTAARLAINPAARRR